MTESAAGARTGVQLVRGLGLLAATAILIGDVVGTGVFLKARVMTCNVGSPSIVLAVWVVGGLLSLAGALTYAELAAMVAKYFVTTTGTELSRQSPPRVAPRIAPQ